MDSGTGTELGGPRYGKRASLVSELAASLAIGAKARVTGDKMIVGPPIIFEVDGEGRYIKVGDMIPEQAGVRVHFLDGQVAFIATATIEAAGELLAEAELMLMRA